MLEYEKDMKLITRLASSKLDELVPSRQSRCLSYPTIRVWRPDKMTNMKCLLKPLDLISVNSIFSTAGVWPFNMNLVLVYETAVPVDFSAPPVKSLSFSKDLVEINTIPVRKVKDMSSTWGVWITTGIAHWSGWKANTMAIGALMPWRWAHWMLSASCDVVTFWMRNYDHVSHKPGMNHVGGDQ